MYDLIIIGGGPSGLFSSIEASKEGLKVLILEEDKNVGIPRHCTGIISKDALNFIGYSAFKSLKNKIKKAQIISYSNKKFQIAFKEYITFILDRIYFEELLLKEAEKNGVEILFNSKVKKIKFNKKIYVKTSNNEFECKGAIYAIGTKTKIIPNFKSPNFIPAIQYEMEGEVEDKEAVKIIFTKEAKGFFAWIAPSSSDTFLVGLANRIYSPKIMLDNFIKKKKIEGKKLAVYSGKIVFDKPLKDTIFKNIVAIGDAASHVKSTTGGGLFYGLLGAKIAGKFFSLYIKTNNKKYLNYIKKFNDLLINKSLNETYKFSKYFFSLPIKYSDYFLNSMEISGIFERLDKSFQDRHENIIKLLLLNRKFSLNLIKEFINKIFH